MIGRWTHYILGAARVGKLRREIRTAHGDAGPRSRRRRKLWMGGRFGSESRGWSWRKRKLRKRWMDGLSGDIMNEHTEDGHIRYVSRGDLGANSTFPVLGPNWDNRSDGRHGHVTGIPSAPEKVGYPPNAPCPLKQKVSERHARDGRPSVRGKKKHPRPPRMKTLPMWGNFPFRP